MMLMMMMLRMLVQAKAPRSVCNVALYRHRLPVHGHVAASSISAAAD